MQPPSDGAGSRLGRGACGMNRLGQVGPLRASRALLSAAVLVAGSVLAQGASAALASAPPQTFNYTGAAQTYNVPASVCSVTVDVLGAAGGGRGGFSAPGGRGPVHLLVRPALDTAG